MTGWTGKRSFIGIVRIQGASTRVTVQAQDEASATEVLGARYGTENLIEVRGVDGRDDREMSQAEADVRAVVMRGFSKAFFAVVKWVLLGTFRK